MRDDGSEELPFNEPNNRNSEYNNDQSTIKTRSDSLLRRQENIQILTAIGILGLAGTLLAQDIISFPLINTLASAPGANIFARIFIYLNVIFLFLKISLVTIRSQSSLISSGQQERDYKAYLFPDRLVEKARWFDQIILPGIFTGLIVIIPVSVILLFLSNYVQENISGINVEVLVSAITAALITTFVLPVLQVLSSGLVKRINEIRKGGAGEDYVREYRSESSKKYMRINDILDQLSGTEEYNINDISDRLREIIRKSREATDPDQIDEYNIISKKLIRDSPLFAKYITRQGMSADEREALMNYLTEIRKFERFDKYDQEHVVDLYDFLDNLIKNFEKEYGIDNKSKQEEISNEKNGS